MHAKHQQGKGLFSFMAGSIAALIAIAGVLFTLNHNKERDFKTPAASRQQPAAASSQTEVLLPGNVPASAAKPTDNTRTTPALEDNEPLVASAPRARPLKPREETEPALIDEQPNANKDKSKKTETARRPPDMMDDPVLGDSTETETPRDTKPRKPETKPADSKADNRQPEKAKLSEAEKRRRQQEDLADRNAKPTAEQILNSGSIEKAREVARQEAQAKRAKQRAAEEAQANKADRAPAQARESKSDQPAAAQNKTGNKTDRTTVQAGAYNSRQAAEAQRAKLALMGVNTQVVEVQSNGKTLYRVQTRSMDSKHANQVRETLQQNGVNSIPRKQ
ncbi:SPOR domain-containing protein [Kingella oralis]|uniref:SPOR domain-containing protein n=1 Tax=Kingella oralis TaxID=505 RepID=UPI002D7E6852|nr:SPOR domain-containing protein [Kingella oralis]